MIELLHELTDWMVGFAASDWAIVILAFTSFIEAIFFPVPPDLLLVGMGILQPKLAIWLGVVVALSSVAGAMVGHWLGRRLGRPLLHRFLSETRISAAERMFSRYGTWTILIAAFTPLPYKVFAISAGVLDLDRRTFFVASLIGRGARYITVGVLVFMFGEEIEVFLSENFAVLTIAVAAAALAGAVGWGYLYRRRRARRAVQ